MDSREEEKYQTAPGLQGFEQRFNLTDRDQAKYEKNQDLPLSMGHFFKKPSMDQFEMDAMADLDLAAHEEESQTSKSSAVLEALRQNYPDHVRQQSTNPSFKRKEELKEEPGSDFSPSGMAKSFSQLVKEHNYSDSKSGPPDDAHRYQPKSLKSEAYRSEPPDTNAKTTDDSPLHTSDLYSKEKAMGQERMAEFMKYREHQQSLRDSNSQKIQKLFQETRDLNKKLFEVRGVGSRQNSRGKLASQNSNSRSRSNSKGSPPHGHLRSQDRNQSRGRGLSRDSSKEGRREKQIIVNSRNEATNFALQARSSDFIESQASMKDRMAMNSRTGSQSRNLQQTSSKRSLDSRERERRQSQGRHGSQNSQESIEESTIPRHYQRNSRDRPPTLVEREEGRSKALSQSQLQALHRLRESNLKLSSQYDKAEEEIDRCHDQIARQASQLHQQKIQIESLTSQLSKLQKTYAELEKTSKQELRSLREETIYQRNEAQRFQTQLSFKEESIQNLQTTMSQYKDKAFYLEEDLANKTKTIDTLRGQLEKFELELLTEQGTKQGMSSISALKLENQQLHKDNTRLLGMLQKTKEFEQFGNFIEDSGGAIRIPKIEKAEAEADNAGEEWIPQEAFNLAHSFRGSHGNDLSPELIHELLANLNKIWQDREKKQLQRQKAKYTDEITKLKRQMISRVPFDALQAKKTIARLTQELHSAKQELAKAQNSKEKQSGMPVGVELIDNTLQVVTQMQQQKKAIVKENEDLKMQVAQLQQYQQEGFDEKKKYMEGAVWMGKKMSNEIEKVCQSYEFLLLEYHQRLKGEEDANSEFERATHNSPEVQLQRSESASIWLVEAVKQAGFGLYEKSITILEGAVYHMDEPSPQGTQDMLKQLKEL